MPPRTNPVSVAPLSESLNKRLAAYALAAGAGLLAAALPAEAGVITITPGTPLTFNNPTNATLDLNNDGITDLTFNSILAGLTYYNGGYTRENSRDLTAEANGIMGSYDAWWNGNWAAIGAGGPWVASPNQGAMARVGFYSYLSRWAGSVSSSVLSQWYGPYGFRSGQWMKGNYYSGRSGGYLGVRFLIDGQARYGWVQIDTESDTGNIQSDPSITVIVNGWAYNDLGGGIYAGTDQTFDDPQIDAVPEPGTLGLLALGAGCLGVWRKRKAASN